MSWQQPPVPPPPYRPALPPPPGPPPGQPPRRSGTPKALVAVGVAVVLVIAIVAIGTLVSGGGIRSDQGRITNAEEFLDDAEQEWRAELPAEGVAVSDDAACFFVIGSDDETTGEVACGGVRRHDADAEHVWDVGSFDAFDSGDGVEASYFYLEESSVERPSGTLRDGSGEEAPGDVDDVEAPTLPQADAGLVVPDFDAESVELTDAVEPGDAGRVRVPGALVEITSVATVAAIQPRDSYDPDDVPEAPADGESFRVVDYTVTATEGVDASYDDRTSVELDTGADQVAVADLDLYGTEVTLLVSAPEGASLVFVSDGHEQRVDLATGERAPDPVADTYYRPGIDQEVAQQQRWPDRQVRLDGEQADVTLETTVESVHLTPYLSTELEASEQGWAADDTAWLVIAVEGDQAEVACCVSGDVSKTTVRWTVTAGDKTYRPPVQRLESYAVDASYVVVAVPATTTEFALAADATSVVRPYGGGGDRTVEHGRQQLSVAFS